MYNPLSYNRSVKVMILTPFKSVRIVFEALYDRIQEQTLKFINLIQLQCPYPYNIGMPSDPKDLFLPPFKQVPSYFEMDYDLKTFFWYDFVHDPRGIAFGSDRFPDNMKRFKRLESPWDVITPINPFQSIDSDVYAIKRVTFEGPPDNPISFYIEPYKDMMFLPDFVERAIYRYFSWDGAWDDTTFHFVCTWIAGALCVYRAGSEIRIAWEFLLITVNPYAYFISSVYWSLYSPWIEKALGRFAPRILTMPTHYTIFFAFTQEIETKLVHLCFTMPYVPSQGVLKTEVINGESVEGLFFEGIPKGWEKTITVTSEVENGINKAMTTVYNKVVVLDIPNHERLYWYFRRDDILQHINKILNIEALPDHLLNMKDLPDHLNLIQ